MELQIGQSVNKYFNHSLRIGYIREIKLDKVKVYFPDSGTYMSQDFNWFDISELISK